MFKTIRTLATAATFATLAATTAFAGSVTPGATFHRVAADSEISFVETFYGGELAMVEIYGDGRSDIDLWIYDEFGNLITRSTSYGAVEYVEFVPAWTGEFEIRIENLGKPRGSDFEIWTN